MPPEVSSGEVLHPVALPARLERRRPLGIGGPVVAHVDRGGRALEDEQLLRRLGQVGDALHRGGAGADDAHPLVGQLREAAVGPAAGVVVVPPAGVEGVAREGLDARDARQLRPVQRTVAHEQEPGPHVVAAVGADHPAVAVGVPVDGAHLGGQARVVVEAEVIGDALAVLEDLRRLGVLLGGDVAGLLEQREVDVGLDVALRAGVAVPVPGAAEVAALLDDADVVDAGLAEPGAGDQPGEPAADEGHGDLVDQRLALGGFDVGVLEVVGELAGHLDVLLVAVGSQALVALELVAPAQLVGVEIHLRLVDGLFVRCGFDAWLGGRHVCSPPVLAPGVGNERSQGSGGCANPMGTVAAVLRLVLIGVMVMLGSWAVLVVLASRLPEGSLKELARFLPDCVTTVRRLRANPDVPRRAKVALAIAGLWVVSPIDLIPEFLPVIGPLDDVVVVALAFRYAARQIPRAVLLDAWPGRPDTIERLLGPARGPAR